MNRRNFLHAAALLGAASCLTPVLAAASASAPASTARLRRLRVLSQAHPRAFVFRIAEHTYHPAAAWMERFSVLQGIEGKALDEELPRLGNLAFFNAYKQAHPDHLVLIHFNGNARDPRWRREPFFDGHWLYFTGATILSDVPATDGDVDIRVSDPSAFRTGIGRDGRRTDDLGLCRLDDEGRPDWSQSEQAELISVDPDRGTIRVRRARFHTRPRSFPAGRSYVAAHVSEGPWGKPWATHAGNMLWYYNFSTLGPRDSQGRSCGDVLAEEFGRLFASDGELAAFDGVQFDVANATLAQHSYRDSWDGREADADADGRPDNGIRDGLDTYGIGTREFYSRLRERIGPDRLILADGFARNNQRGFGLLNGIESEGWPRGDDRTVEDWSGGLNRHAFWREFGAAPTLSYTKHAYWEKADAPPVPLSTTRLVLAAMVLTDSAVSLSDLPPAEPESRALPVWDELVGGSLQRPGWLGAARGPAMRWARTGPLAIPVRITPAELAQRIGGPGIRTRATASCIEISGTAPAGDGRLRFAIGGLTSHATDLTVILRIRGQGRRGHPAGYARLLDLNVRSSSWSSPARMTWVGEQPFEAGFYFHASELAGATDLVLEAEIEGSEPVVLESLEAFAAPDVQWRAFEHGLVLANPSPHPVTLDPAAITPGVRYRRLAGCAQQDPVVNDGSRVEGPIVLSGKDALFLIREDARSPSDARRD